MGNFSLREFRHDVSEWCHLRRAWLRSASGVELRRKKTPVIVSLTTIPERLAKIPIAIEGLLRQTSKPDQIILWLDKKLAADVPPLLRRQAR